MGTYWSLHRCAWVECEPPPDALRTPWTGYRVGLPVPPPPAPAPPPGGPPAVRVPAQAVPVRPADRSPTGG